MSIRVLFLSRTFYPHTGGAETVTRLLAKGCAAAGMEVKLVTYALLNGQPELSEGYLVVRRPSSSSLLKLVAWCTIFFHHSVSLRGSWPLLVYRRKWVMLHHITYCRADGTSHISGHVKRWVSRLGYSVACSTYVNATLPRPGMVIPNPYDAQVYRLYTGMRRTRDLLFIARLVPEKGGDLLLQSLELINSLLGFCPTLTIAGDGPQREELIRKANSCGISGRIAFKGMLSPEQLAIEMNRHLVLVVPSQAKETFGMVVLEGLACGCLPLTHADGGLMQAGGSFGLQYERGNVYSLAHQIVCALNRPVLQLHESIPLEEKLQRHTLNSVVNRYQVFFTRILKKHRS